MQQIRLSDGRGWDSKDVLFELINAREFNLCKSVFAGLVEGHNFGFGIEVNRLVCLRNLGLLRHHFPCVCDVGIVLRLVGGEPFGGIFLCRIHNRVTVTVLIMIQIYVY